MKRLILVAGALAVLVVAGALVFLISSLDALVERVIERTGSELTGTRVELDSVEIDLGSGRGTLLGLSVANPAGFSSGDALRLGEITVEIDLATLSGEPLVIRTVRIDAPVARFEADAQGRSNVDAIRRHLEETGSAGDAGTAEGTGGADASARRLRIDSFSFENGELTSDTTALGGEVHTQTLPALRLRQLGGTGGAPPAKIGEDVLRAFLTQIAKATAGGRLERLVDEKLGGEAGEAAKGVLRKLLD